LGCLLSALQGLVPKRSVFGDIGQVKNATSLSRTTVIDLRRLYLKRSWRSSGLACCAGGGKSHPMVGVSRLLLPDGTVHELRGTCTLGRSARNTLALANEHVSRKHALLQSQGEGEYWMVDLGSSNGTYVNGRRVSRPLALKHGDVIEMAGSRLEFQTDGDSATPYCSSQGPTVPVITKRKCWLMVADIAGSTRMAQELPPEEIPQITGGWFNACLGLIEQHGGHMNQYLGDGYFCYWEEASHVQDQILAALRELAGLQAKASPNFRIVLHYGETVFSGVPTTSEQNLHGQEVHFVFRMEKIAAKFGDTLLCSDAAWRALGTPSLVQRQSEVSGYNGIYQFHVPELGA